MCGRWSGIVDDGAVLIFDRAAAGFRQGVQDRIQLGTNGVAESTCEMPHAVPPLLQFEIPAVLLQLIIDGLRPVGVGGVDHGVGEPLQLRRRQDGGVVGEQLFGGLDACGSRSWRVSLCMARSTMATFSVAHHARRVAAPPVGAAQGPACAEHRGTRSDGGGGTDPGRGVTGGQLQHPHQELGHGGGAVLLRQMVGFGVGDQLVIDERLPVAEGFEALPHRDLLLS